MNKPNQLDWILLKFFLSVLHENNLACTETKSCLEILLTLGCNWAGLSLAIYYDKYKARQQKKEFSMPFLISATYSDQYIKSTHESSDFSLLKIAA